MSTHSHRPAAHLSRLGLLGPLFSATLLLAACGGGGSDTPSPSPPPGPPAPVKVAGVVADGPLRGAIACFDLNDNNACDGDEPKSAASDAEGGFSIDVPAGQEGKHAVIVSVPADAVDKDTGAAVGAAFTLRAPPSNAGAQAVFVSPLTTLVATVAQQQNISITAATDQVKAQLGMSGSPLANFVATPDAQAAKLAASVNAVIVDITKLASAASVPAAQTQALINAATTDNLPALAAQVAAAPASATPQQVAQAVSAAVQTAANLTPTTVVAQAQAQSQLAAPLQATTQGPFVSVRRFAYTDAGNYSYTLFTGDSSKLDANGRFVAHEVRKTQSAAADAPFNRNRAYWNGSAWQVCNRAWEVVSTTHQTTTTPQSSTYCGGSKSESRITSEDIAGKKMADVVAAMRAYPLPDSGGLPTAWGPDPALLGDAVFPAGSSLSTRSSTNEIGNTESFGLLDKVVWRYLDGSYRHMPDFDSDDGQDHMPGNFIDPSATVGDGNAVFLDEHPVNPAPADTTLRAVARYLVAFAPIADSNVVRFYKCDVLAATGASTNCATVGDGAMSTTEETKGNARIARFASGYPTELLTKANRQRFFVERDGTVFRGTTDLQRTVYNQRLNGPAWEALRNRLGIAAHTEPTAPVTAGPFAVLRDFTFTDVNNYSLRAFNGDSSVLDAEGYFLANEVRESKLGGVAQTFMRNRLFWTGSAWFDCGSSGVGVIRANSRAPFNSIYCQAYLDERASSTTVTLDGRRMSEVVRDIRRYGSKDSGYDYRNWGPDQNVHTQLASAFFPAGSTMEYRGHARRATPVSIATGPNNTLRIPPANPSVPFNTWPLATTLEGVVTGYPGNWLGAAAGGANTQYVWRKFLAAAPSPDVTREVEIRVAFDANGAKARFYECNRAVITGARVNCTGVLDTTYTVETLGAARVMKFTAMPANFERDFLFQRMFAEYGGNVWYAYKEVVPASPNYSIRLNQAAAQALLTALGI